ncbi:MAG: hypothetical protein GQ574_27670 [Crocinitomix sp.]|nr:hypothetical protein [Crocinitomix sp.]
MTRLFSILIFLISANTIAQDLTVVIGSEDAYCRTSGEQYGNGIVWAYAEGGVPVYTYTWRDLTTGDIHPATTWGGLNVGCYEITVIDMEGTIAMDTVCIDSINPIAEFLVVSAELDSLEWAYVGEAPVNVSFQTVGIPLASPPFFDTSFIFRPQGFEPWIAYEDEVGEFMTYYFEYGGDYTASMIAINHNGCTDTAHARIYLTGPAGLNDRNEIDLFSIITHSNSSTITVTMQGYKNDLNLSLYTISGQKIQSHRITEPHLEIVAPSVNGIYIYEVIDPKTGQKIAAGKIQL